MLQTSGLHDRRLMLKGIATMPKQIPDANYLRKILRYEPETGKLFWRERTQCMFSEGNRGSQAHCNSWNKRFAGREALSHKTSNGYLSGRIDYKLFFAHRIVWAIYYGKPPINNIDHINGDKSDNRIENLRDVTQRENSKNSSLRKSNKVGVPGIYWIEDKKKWHVRMKIGGIQKSLGYFDHVDDAIAARLNAQIEHGYHSNHGRKKK